jgi:parallel beta-helix repeat protein
MKKILILIFCIAFPAVLQGKTLYVDVDDAGCSDDTTYANNDADNPWCTIGRAAWGNASRSTPSTTQAAQAGDVVLISAGIYWTDGPTVSDRFGVALNPANSGTSGNPITFRGVGEVYVRMNYGFRSGMIGSAGRDYIVWDNFYIDDYYGGSLSDTGPVIFTGGASYCQLINSTVVGHPGSYYHEYATFTGNYNGIRLEPAHHTTIKNNEIYNVTGTQNEAGIMLYSSTYSIIENNHIHDCGTGIYVKGETTVNQEYNTIRYNLVEDCTASGISHGYFNRYGETYQNIVSGCGSGIVIRTLDDGDQILNSYIVNNTLFDNDQHFLVMVDAGTNTTVANNITSGGTNVYWSWGGTDQSDNTYDRNNLYGQSGIFAYMASGNYTLSQWQAAFGYDANSVTTDPSFTDAANGDFTLQAGSPALTLGRTITAIHGTSGETIPAGAYITGTETIGIESTVSSTPSITGIPTIIGVTIQ